MANEVGKRYKCQKCGAEFIVTRGGKGELYCCSQQMQIKKQASNIFRIKREEYTMAQLGKRYRCEACNTEILCTKVGEGNPVCCDKEMKILEPKPLPSSD